jgi:hypothetical protein
MHIEVKPEVKPEVKLYAGKTRKSLSLAARRLSANPCIAAEVKCKANRGN